MLEALPLFDYLITSTLNFWHGARSMYDVWWRMKDEGFSTRNEHKSSTDPSPRKDAKSCVSPQRGDENQGKIILPILLISKILSGGEGLQIKVKKPTIKLVQDSSSSSKVHVDIFRVKSQRCSMFPSFLRHHLPVFWYVEHISLLVPCSSSPHP